MPKAVVTTKLHMPAPRANGVIRPRLLSRLDEGMAQGRRLILVSAAAGAGKTTLLAGWLSERMKDEGRRMKPHSAVDAPPSSFIPHPSSFAWLSLDPDDNDPTRFWAYVIAALQTTCPGFGQTALDALQAPQPPPLPLVLPDLLNDLAGLTAPLALVLDDYHVIAAPAIHESLAFVLDHAPVSLRLVVATRADPPLPLARLRARDELIEVRAADLRFTGDEARVFLAQAMGLSVPPDAVDLLVARTEGWAVGLQLAGLSLRGRDDPRAYIESFSGGHHYVLDYLVEEVLSRQPAYIQEFLSATAILERLCAPLCDAIRGQEDNQALLEQLEEQNLFLVPLDDERRWYRYHQLFRDLLLARLTQTRPDAISRLHRRAAAWFDAQGLPGEAVSHAFAANDPGYAADLIERHIPARWALGDATFLSLIGRLPSDMVQARPGLAIHHAFALIIFGEHQAAEVVLRGMLPRIPAEATLEETAIASFARVLLAYLAELGGAAPVELPDPRSLQHVPPHRLAMRNTADATYAFLLQFRGEFARAEALLLDTIARDMAAQGATAIAVAGSRLGRIRIVQGRLRDAAALCRGYLQQMDARGQRRYYIGGGINLVLGDVLREWNELEVAEQEIRRGIELNAAWPSPESRAIGAALLARVRLARRDLSGALAVWQEVEQLLTGRLLSPDILSDLWGLRVRLWLAQGDLSAATTWIARRDPRPPLSFRHERDQITRARVLLAQGAASEVHAVLCSWRQAAREGGRAGRLIEISLLDALALDALDRRSEALDVITDCMALAEPEGYVRIFLDEGPAMAALLEAQNAKRKAQNDPIQRYCANLLDAISPAQSLQPEDKATALRSDALPLYFLAEPLTPREHEVLRLICAGDSNQAIAAKLVITVAAVKKHSGNIFGKLGVSSRTQAIVRARELGLFD